MTLIDGFGLHRNTYLTLMGMYFIFAGLSFHERARRSNVIPLTLGPPGSNFSDVDALKALKPLDRGIEVEVEGEKVLLCAFTLAYIGDMPQQQKNAGMKTQRANLGCRFCHIASDDRGSLDFDTFLSGRYHHSVVEMRNDIDALRTKALRETYGKIWGIDPDPASMALSKISPALDLIQTRPSDPAHSEYNGLSNMMHSVLLEAILTAPAANAYAAVLRSFPFPPRWPRCQGPLHHLKSYSLSEHARWSVVVPLLLLCWLQERHIRPYLLAIRKKNDADPVKYLVHIFAAAATSNCLLMGSSMTPDNQANLGAIVHSYRIQLQALLQLVADSMTADPRRARSRSASVC